MGGALSNERMYNLVLLLKTNDCPVSHIIWKGLTISDFLNIETTEAAKIFIRKMKQEKPNNFIAIAQYITKLVPAVSMLILDPNQKDKTSDVSALLNYICYIFSVSCDKAINSVWFHPLISHNDIVLMLKNFLNIFGIHDSAENFYHSSNMYLRSISFKCVLFFVFSSVYSDKTNHSIHDYQDFFLEGVDPTIFLELIIPYANINIKSSMSHYNVTKIGILLSLLCIYSNKDWKTALFKLSKLSLINCFSLLFNTKDSDIIYQLLTLFYFTLIEKPKFMKCLIKTNTITRFIIMLLDHFKENCSKQSFILTIIMLIINKMTSYIEVLIQINEKYSAKKSYIDLIIEILSSPIFSDYSTNKNLCPYFASILMNISGYSSCISDSSIGKIFFFYNLLYSKQYYNKEECIGVGDRILLCIFQLMINHFSRVLIYENVIKMKDLFQKLSCSSVKNWRKVATRILNIVNNIENDVITKNLIGFSNKNNEFLLTHNHKSRKLEFYDLTIGYSEMWDKWFGDIFQNLYPNESNYATQNFFPLKNMNVKPKEQSSISQNNHMTNLFSKEDTKRLENFFQDESNK